MLQYWSANLHDEDDTGNPQNRKQAAMTEHMCLCQYCDWGRESERERESARERESERVNSVKRFESERVLTKLGWTPGSDVEGLGAWGVSHVEAMKDETEKNLGETR